MKMFPTDPGQGTPRDLRLAHMPHDWKVLVLAPHPDDFDACGVTLRFLAEQGHPLYAAVTPTGSGVQEGYRPGFTLAQKTVLRMGEQRDSLRFFGLPEACLTFIDLLRDADDQLSEVAANAETVGALLRAQAPNIVLLPHGNDTNSAHRAMCAIVRRAAGWLAQPPTLWLCRDPKTISMRYDLYLAFGETEAAWKGKLLRFHDSQQQRNLNTRGHGFDQRLLELNRQSARDLKLDEAYAEVFEIERAGGGKE